jgi:phosphatidate phosphatase PAH1
MSSISQYLPALPDPGAEDAVINKLRLLKDGSDDCLRYAQGIEEEFNNWLLLVCELHQVTVAKEGKTDEAQEENETKIGSLKVKAECTESTLKSTNDMAKTLKKTLDSSRKSFEKAANALPGRGFRLWPNHHCLYHANILVSMGVYWPQSLQ